MAAYEEEDVTVIQIMDDDKLSEKETYLNYLTPDLNYIYGYEKKYNKKNFYLAGYPENRNERSISSGRITQVIDYKFYHTLDTREGSSGSPIVNFHLNVIGIHSCGFESLGENGGTFIGKILDNLKTSSYFAKNNMNIHNNDNNLNNNTFLSSDRAKIIPKIILDNKKENFIIGKIYINEELVQEEVKIINSNEKNKKELEKNCIIEIDGRKIPFSDDYVFNKTGEHTIKYSFKNYFTNTFALFSNCSYLTSLDFSNFDSTNITDMSRKSNGNGSLTSTDLTNCYTKNITDMSQLFSGCKSLISLDLSNFDTKYVTDMSKMFFECKSLISLDLSNFYTKYVTDMSEMFRGCKSLISLDLSNFITTKDTKMKFIFADCKSLKRLSQIKFNKEKNKRLNEFITLHITLFNK